MVQRCHTDSFVGRRWAVSRIVDWWRSGAPVLVVSGGAGAGKTALINALAAGHCPTADGLTFHAVHRCQGHVSASTDPIRVLSAIAGQLTRTVPGYHVYPPRPGDSRQESDRSPAGRATQAVLDSPSPAAAYDTALLLPFEVLASQHQRAGVAGGQAVVVIDGLDEAPYPNATTGLVEVLAERLATEVTGLRLLLTVRSGSALERLRPEIRLDLTDDCPGEVDDIRAYLDVAGGLPRH